jgi:hypothetical protein
MLSGLGQLLLRLRKLTLEVEALVYGLHQLASRRHQARLQLRVPRFFGKIVCVA